MKKMLLALLVLAFLHQLQAQTSGGPDAYGYTWKTSAHSTNPPSYNWVDITTRGTLVTGLADDNYVGPFNLAIPFHFYWYDVDKFYIGSNGYISFGPTQMSSAFPASVPLTSGGNNWIAPLMADLIFGQSGSNAACYYLVKSDSIIVSFINVPFWQAAAPGYTGSNTFQIILNRVDTSITFNYQYTSMGSLTSIDDVVGIENVTGSIGLGTYIDVLPTYTLTVRYYYPANTTYAVTDAGMKWNQNADNGGIFVKAQGAATTLKACTRNYGNQTLSSFSVYDTIYNFSNTAVTNGTKSFSGLAVGKDSIYNFSNTFSPSLAGIYTYTTNIQGVMGDMVAANNRLQQEIIAVDTTTSSIWLEYTDQAYNAGLGWNGGNGGVAVYFEPPFYPFKITGTRFYISANASTPVGFYAKIYDDDGPNGSHGTLLDSVYVPPTSITTGTYVNVNTANSNLKVYSGGVYVLWLMEGAGINIGKDLTPPFSRRTYEVLFNAWSDYRDVNTEDFMIGLKVEYTMPKADFSVDSTYDPVLSFTDLSSNTPTSWSWNFGDNTTSTLQNPSHTYATNGLYNVCLTATNGDGATTKCKYLKIKKNPPDADFSFDTLNNPLITFTDLSTNLPTSWYWKFDELGATSTLKNPSRTFKINGSKNVCLKVTNLGGSDSICKNVIIKYAKAYASFSADTSGDPVISFTDQSQNNPNSWNWDFGDNSTHATTQNPSHTYMSNGTFNVCLIATNAYGADTFCKQITIRKRPPTADFYTINTLDPKIQFRDTSSNNPTSWFWDFDENGATSTQQHPQYTFTVNGLHKVCLKVSNLGGSDSICKNITVYKVKPISNWEFDTASDPTIIFTDKSLNIPTSWLWTFDDNAATSTQQNPTYTFTKNGLHYVCLKAINAGGDNTYCQKVYIRNLPPVASFSIDSLSDPLIKFTDKSTNLPIAWHWDFDDNGASSALQNPSYNYITNGKRKVCLKVSTAGGADSVCKFVTIKKCRPIAFFSADTSGDPTIKFSDLSQNIPTAWLWDFDDNFITSNLQNPTYTFKKMGVHNVCLIVTNAGGKDTFCMTITIRNVPPVADFIMNNSLDPMVSFIDKSTNSPTSWYWDFDDSGSTSSIQNPTYTFKSNGTHKICLKIANGGGADSICKNLLVRKVLPVADFIADTSQAPLISFIDKTSNLPTSWKWTFDDKGATSLLQNPTYTYSKNGTYNVCLIATNAGGSDTICKSVTIRTYLPVAAFTFDKSLDPQVTFTDISTNIPHSWHWDFDEYGASSTLQNPVYSFRENTTHRVCLLVENYAGKDSLCQDVIIRKALPIANFDYVTDSMPTIYFTDKSTGAPVQWHWNFDDKGADSSTQQNPSYTFHTDGSHNVCLIAKNSVGFSNAFCSQITITGAGTDEAVLLKTILVYPNPFSQHTVIELKSGQNYPDLKLLCYDMMGKTISCHYTVLNNRIELSGEKLSKGVYFFDLNSRGNLIGRGRFIVK